MFQFRREQFVQWVESLSDTQTPSWLGLPNNAEKVLLTNKGDLTHYSSLEERGEGGLYPRFISHTIQVCL